MSPLYWARYECGPADPGPLAGVTQVAVGEAHACARLSNSRVVCWGESGAGQLGNGSNQDKARPVVVRNPANNGPLTGVTQVAAGDTHTCARLTNGQGVCWGADDQGQLGEDASVGVPAFVPVGIASITGSGRLNGITQLVAGTRHVCALLVGRQVRCWGSNVGGQVGDGSNETRPFPVAVESVNGVTALTDVTQISAGSSHTCARLSTGQARCWGEGDKGELGDTVGNDRNRPGIVRAPTGTAALTGVTQVSAGGFHTCFRLTNGQARCTGSNSRGQLGNPNVDEVLRPVVVRAPGNAGPLGNVAQLASGGLHTCARLVSGQVRCWGHGGGLELGNNSLLDAELPVVVRIS